MGKTKYQLVKPKMKPKSSKGIVVDEAGEYPGEGQGQINYLDHIWSKSVPESPGSGPDSNATENVNIKRKPPRFTSVLDTPTHGNNATPRIKTNLRQKMKASASAATSTPKKATQSKCAGTLSKMVQFLRGKGGGKTGTRRSTKHKGQYSLLVNKYSPTSLPPQKRGNRGMKRQKSELEFSFGPNKMLGMKKRRDTMDSEEILKNKTAAPASELIEETEGSLLFRAVTDGQNGANLLKEAKDLVEEIMASFKDLEDKEDNSDDLDSFDYDYELEGLIEIRLEELKAKLEARKEAHSRKVQLISEQIGKLDDMKKMIRFQPLETTV